MSDIKYIKLRFDVECKSIVLKVYSLHLCYHLGTCSKWTSVSTTASESLGWWAQQCFSQALYYRIPLSPDSQLNTSVTGQPFDG